ncbi:GNAT family N-acetyltransferase [Mycobacterium sp. 1274756.6]|uniref:N-acetylglutamate synthase, CG3035 family n=1 Tax=Mycobacterium sp. 1274756.6 TaxID=1834076 RepID=UPI00080230F7|nr:GNAT family N-acetyltransferase [Mycobacterium sp. 1274756.6]OBJ69159.1 GCN5 family acetyltransferase [Mycobacterium sp. 1274756.6]
MSELPSVGTRVAVRFRLPAGSEPPLSDAVGHLLAVAPVVRVRTKTGEVVEFSPDDVLTVRRLTDVPVRNSQIRAVEHAAALAFPGTEQRWLDGWLLRVGAGATFRANSAIPLEMGASFAAVPAIVDFYVERGRTPLFAVPDRLVSMRDDTPVERENRTLVTELPATLPHRPEIALAADPGPDWLAGYDRDVPVGELTAVLDGQVCFAVGPAGAVARAAITAAPDGTRWVGLSDVRVDAGQRRRGQASAVCAALLAWAVEHGATDGYAQVRDGDDAALGLFTGLGFTPQHRLRYVRTEAIWAGPTTRRR